jgi:hypothetical protein
MENGARAEAALCAAQDFTVRAGVEVNKDSVLVDILPSKPMRRVSSISKAARDLPKTAICTIV